jgi:hypothetical protein
MALTDLAKACDDPIEILWTEKENININPILIKATMNLYKNTTRIKISSKLMQGLKTMKVLERDTVQNLTEPYKNGKVQVETWDCRWEMTYTLYFTDDQIVIAEDKDNLSYITRKLQEAYEHRGLLTNKKYEYIFGNNAKKKDLTLEDYYISVVHKCKYLGVLLNKTGYSSE